MSITEFYGRWAALYDRIATAPGVARWRRVAAECVAEQGDTVVEMGCGTGVNLPYLSERVGPTGTVIGVDITGPLLNRAHEYVVELDNASVVHGDGTCPPISEADAVLGTFVCGLFSHPAAVVDEWCDLVESGGRVALMDATATEEGIGRPLNPLFRLFVAAGAPGSTLGDILGAPFDRFDAPLSRRVEASRTALTARTETRHYETFAAGFVGLLSGRVR